MTRCGRWEGPHLGNRTAMRDTYRRWNKMIEDDEGRASTVGAYIDGHQDLEC